MSERAAVRQREVAQQLASQHARMLWDFLTNESMVETPPNMWDAEALRERGMSEEAISRWQQPQEVLGAMPDVSPRNAAQIAQFLNRGVGNAKNFIRAYHGTTQPDITQFNLAEKLKHGDSLTPASAMGHGHYFAQDPHIANIYRGMAAQHRGLPGGAGNIYAVNIEANPRHLLDLNRPIAQQSDEVLDALHRAEVIDRNRLAEAVATGNPKADVSGRYVQENLAPFLPGRPASLQSTSRAINPNKQYPSPLWTEEILSPQGTEHLRSAGLSGARVIDHTNPPRSPLRRRGPSAITDPRQELRPAMRNYVVWDDDLINVAGHVDPRTLEYFGRKAAVNPNRWIQNFLNPK
jgi:hypothetical protein